LNNKYFKAIIVFSVFKITGIAFSPDAPHHIVGSHPFFFFLISNCNYLKAQRGATLIHGKYTREPLKRTNRN